MEGKLPSSQDELAGGARAGYGAEDALAAIRQQLAPYATFPVEPAILSKHDVRGRDVERDYKTTVIGAVRNRASPKALLSIRLNCQVAWSTIDHDAIPQSCTSTMNTHDVPEQLLQRRHARVRHADQR